MIHLLSLIHHHLVYQQVYSSTINHHFPWSIYYFVTHHQSTTLYIIIDSPSWIHHLGILIIHLVSLIHPSSISTSILIHLGFCRSKASTTSWTATWSSARTWRWACGSAAAWWMQRCCCPSCPGPRAKRGRTILGSETKWWSGWCHGEVGHGGSWRLMELDGGWWRLMKVHGGWWWRLMVDGGWWMVDGGETMMIKGG